MIKPGIPKTTSSWPTPLGYDPQSILQPTKSHTIFCIYIYTVHIYHLHSIPI